jgi:hypothetical protein
LISKVVPLSTDGLPPHDPPPTASKFVMNSPIIESANSQRNLLCYLFAEQPLQSLIVFSRSFRASPIAPAQAKVMQTFNSQTQGKLTIFGIWLPRDVFQKPFKIRGRKL